MASPSVSTPTSAGSPAPIAPAPQPLAIKAVGSSTVMGHALVQSMAVPGLITRKEWVVPPRPKPGRKPATDTPPTKRKAQNRAAQRAFRERRAARVGELEENLEEVKEGHQQREAQFTRKIAKLEADVERFSGELQSWKFRCDTLDRIVDYERKEKESALAELAYLRNGFHSSGTEAVPLPPRHLRHPEPKLSRSDPQQATNIVSVAEVGGCGGCTSMDGCACIEQAIAISATGCGNCSADTHCQCLEETIQEAAARPGPSEPKRSHSPWADNHIEKRTRHQSPSTPLEIDFTTQFASKPVVQAHPEAATESGARDSCGFCEEGTYCMCAEAAAATSNSTTQQHENRLAPLLNEVTPPPSDTDVDGSSLKLPSLQPNQMHRAVPPTAPTNSCVNGPGTCQQCQSDPKSGLFCRSLASMRTAGGSVSGNCCGGSSSDGGCCKSVPPAMGSSQPPPSLSCADTYITLSTHKHFDQASEELNTWLGRLHASPPSHTGRAPMEVEAASVMWVLKLFDRRFGRG